MSPPHLRWTRYRTATGACPVKEFLDSLDDPDCVDKIQALMAYVIELGPARAGQKKKIDRLSDDIWEVRIPYDTRAYRVLYARQGSTLVALHAFQKKTKKTPPDLIRLAEQRLQDWQSRMPRPA